MFPLGIEGIVCLRFVAVVFLLSQYNPGATEENDMYGTPYKRHKRFALSQQLRNAEEQVYGKSRGAECKQPDFHGRRSFHPGTDFPGQQNDDDQQ